MNASLCMMLNFCYLWGWSCPTPDAPSEGDLRERTKENKAFAIWRGLSVQYQDMPVWPSRARVWFPEVAEVLVGAEAGACR